MQERRSGGINRQVIISITSPVIIFILWEAFSRTGMIDRRFLPAPSTIGISFFSMITGGGGSELLVHLRATLARVVAGYFLGVIPGISLGITMGLSKGIRAFMRPLIVASYPVPKIALFPLVMLFFGLGELSNIVIVAIGVFFPVLYNTIGGVVGIPQIFWDVARNYNAQNKNLFFTVALPGAMPSIFTGLRLGIGMALIVAVAAEYVSARQGLGFMIWFAWQVLSVDQMFVGIIVISVIGFTLNFLLEKLESTIIPWKI